MNLVEMPPPSPLTEAIRYLQSLGHTVGLTGDIPGLFRVDDGPEITTNQLFYIARSKGFRA